MQLLAVTRKVQAEAAALRALAAAGGKGNGNGGSSGGNSGSGSRPATATRETKPPPPVVVPKEFLCPITQEMMDDPVTTTDGHAYERLEIFRWLCTHNTSPLTGATLPNKFLTPALALRQLIAAFKAEHPDLVDSLV